MLGRDTQTAHLHKKNFAILDIKIMWRVFAIRLICRETYMYGGDLSGQSSTFA
jgi:hypothetical protein